jgi:hypothetical protein
VQASGFEVDRTRMAEDGGFALILSTLRLVARVGNTIHDEDHLK